jgi:Protein of unknown function (DUF3108)
MIFAKAPPSRVRGTRFEWLGIGAATPGASVIAFLSCLIWLSVVRPAGAAELAALYRAYWAGLPAGEIRLALHEDPAAYRDEIEISTEGLPRLVTRFRGSAVSSGRLAGVPSAAPQHYDAVYDLRKRRGRRLSMRFAARAGASVAERGPDDTSRKPPLAEGFRTNVLDPLSALTAIRRALRRGSRGVFAIPVYDGARRFDVRVRVVPTHARDATLRVELTLVPIAGFKGESSDDGDPDDAPRPVALAMTDDARLMPLRMRVSLYYLPLVVELQRWCTAAATCRW